MLTTGLWAAGTHAEQAVADIAGHRPGNADRGQAQGRGQERGGVATAGEVELELGKITVERPLGQGDIGRADGVGATRDVWDGNGQPVGFETAAGVHGIDRASARSPGGIGRVYQTPIETRDGGGVPDEARERILHPVKQEVTVRFRVAVPVEGGELDRAAGKGVPAECHDVCVCDAAGGKNGRQHGIGFLFDFHGLCRLTPRGGGFWQPRSNRLTPPRSEFSSRGQR